MTADRSRPLFWSWAACWSLLVAAASVVFGGEGGHGLDAGFGVAGQGAGVLVTALGLEQDRRHRFLAELGQGTVRRSLVKGRRGGVQIESLNRPGFGGGSVYWFPTSGWSVLSAV